MDNTTGGIDIAGVVLDADRLDVYRVAREFDRMATGVAEGCGRFARAEKAHFYLIARGSAMECAAAFDIALSRGWVEASSYRHARGLLARIVQMLTRLALRSGRGSES